MPSILPAALIGSTALSAGAGVLGAKSAATTQSNAAIQAAQIQQQAAQQAAQLQLGFFNTIRGDLSPYRDVGSSALPAYYGLLGLPPPRSAPATTAGGVTGPGGTPTGNPNGNTVAGLTLMPDGTYGIPGGTAAPPPAASPYKAGDPNWKGYLDANPDVLAEYNKILPTVDWNSPWAAQHGFTQGGGPEAFAQYHYQTNGQAEGRQLPTWTQQQIDQAYPQTTNAGGAANGGGASGTQLAIPGSAPIDASGIQAYLENLPGYQFTKQQGIQAVTNALGARGLSGGQASAPGGPQSLSGSFGKGISRFVTGLADQTYGEQLDRIGRAVGVGQSAANQTGAFGQAATTGAAGSLVGGAAANASGVIGAAGANAAGTLGATQAIGGAANNALNGYLTSRVLSMYNPSTST